jgi:hypothetical protein
MVKFADSKDQASVVIERISPRAVDILGGFESLQMDLCAADGVNGNPPIDWPKLFAASDATLIHDVAGIARHMNRRTGKVSGFFLPRCTMKQEAEGGRHA